MSTTTDKLALFKYDPSTDGAQTFNIQKALNDNWDKLDNVAKEILTTLANKAPATHAAQHAKGGADPITPAAIGSVGYDAQQSLSNAQKAQARGNISALNGQFLVAESAGGQIGWYRITEPFAQYNTSGYLTVSHAWANGGASELLLGVSANPDTHGKLQCLRSVGQINSVPYISNARLVAVSGSMCALDLYVSGAGKNDWSLQLCNCGFNPITLIPPTFISADDTLPSGETLAAVMEYQNPPMLLGVEYKTTERYLGKPVYCKVVDCGVLPSGATLTVKHEIANVEMIVEAKAIASNSTAAYNGRALFPQIYENSLTDRWTNYLVAASSGEITIFCGGGLAGCSVYVMIRYTKTTQ